MKTPALAVLSAALILGCDPFGGEADETKASVSHEETRRDASEERDRFARSMTDYANGLLRLVQSRAAELKGEADGCRADVERLSGLVRREQEKDQKIEQRLLNLMRDPDVNALAKKHLATDFSGLQGEFIERVRTAREGEAAYRKARAESEASYGQAVQEAQKWSQATAEQRDAEIQRIKAEIAVLERRRAEVYKNFQESTRKILVGNAGQERERQEKRDVLERRVSDMDREIYAKRGQIDYLRNPTVHRGIASRTADRVQDVQRQANNLRQQALHDIDLYYKPKATVTDVVAAWAEKTVGLLQTRLAEKVAAAEKNLAGQSERVRAIKEALLAIPVSDLGELKRLKAKIEGTSSGKRKE